jgi:hypothetical protein
MITGLVKIKIFQTAQIASLGGITSYLLQMRWPR